MSKSNFLRRRIEEILNQNDDGSYDVYKDLMGLLVLLDERGIFKICKHYVGDLRAGEPGVMLENLCQMLEEEEIAIPRDAMKIIVRAGQSMGIEPKWWKDLIVTE
jgi:hypothetical protein